MSDNILQYSYNISFGIDHNYLQTLRDAGNQISNVNHQISQWEFEPLKVSDTQYLVSVHILFRETFS